MTHRATHMSIDISALAGYRWPGGLSLLRGLGLQCRRKAFIVRSGRLQLLRKPPYRLRERWLLFRQDLSDCPPSAFYFLSGLQQTASAWIEFRVCVGRFTSNAFGTLAYVSRLSA